MLYHILSLYISYNYQLYNYSKDITIQVHNSILQQNMPAYLILLSYFHWFLRFSLGIIWFAWFRVIFKSPYSHITQFQGNTFAYFKGKMLFVFGLYNPSSNIWNCCRPSQFGRQLTCLFPIFYLLDVKKL